MESSNLITSDSLQLSPGTVLPDNSQRCEIVEEQPKFGDVLKVFQELQRKGAPTKTEFTSVPRLPVKKLVFPINIDQGSKLTRKVSDVENDPILLELRTRNRVSTVAEVSKRERSTSDEDTVDSSRKPVKPIPPKVKCKESAKEKIRQRENNALLQNNHTESLPSNLPVQEEALDDSGNPSISDESFISSIVEDSLQNNLSEQNAYSAKSSNHDNCVTSVEQPTIKSHQKFRDKSPPPDVLEDIKHSGASVLYSNNCNNILGPGDQPQFNKNDPDVEDRYNPPDIVSNLCDRPLVFEGTRESSPTMSTFISNAPRPILKTNAQTPKEIILESTNFSQEPITDELQHVTMEVLGTDDEEDESSANSSYMCSPASFMEDENKISDEPCFYEIAGLPVEFVDPEITFGQTKCHIHRKVSFSTRPIKVFDAHSIEEYDRTNSLIKPHLAAMEYELEKHLETLQIIDVELNKGSSNAGIKVVGVGRDKGAQKLGIYISEIIDGSPAHIDGRMQKYDQILEVNGVSLLGVDKEFAARALRCEEPVVNFKIGREVNQVAGEIVQLVNMALDKPKKAVLDEFENNNCEDLDDNEQELEAQRTQEQLSRLLHELALFSNHINLPSSVVPSDLAFIDDSEEAEEIAEAANNAQNALDSAQEKFESEIGNGLSTDLCSAIGNLGATLRGLEHLALYHSQEVRKLEQELREERKTKVHLMETCGSQAKQLSQLEQQLESVTQRDFKEAELEARLAELEAELTGYRDLMEDTQGQNIKLEEMTKKYKKVKRIMKDSQASEKTLKQERDKLLKEVEQKEAYIIYIKETVNRLQSQLSMLQESGKLNGGDKVRTDGSYATGGKPTGLNSDKRMDQIFDSHPLDSTIRKPPKKTDSDENLLTSDGEDAVDCMTDENSPSNSERG